MTDAGRVTRTGTRSLTAALLARELRPGTSATVLVIATTAAAAALGRHVASQQIVGGAALGARPFESLATFAAWQLAQALPLPFAIGAAWRVIDRVRGDERDGWFAPLAAGGESRTSYLLAVWLGAALAMLVAFALALAGYVLGIAAADDATTASIALAEVGRLAGAPPLLAAAAAYGALAVATVPARGGTLAAAGILVPVALATWWTTTATETTHLMRRLLVLHAPPFSWTPRADVVAQHALYVVVALTLAGWLARHHLVRAR